MLAPAPAAGLDAASTITGRRMFPRTSPTRPPRSAVTKHQRATATRRSASRRLNIADDRAHAPRERVDPAGPVRRCRPAEGPADRLRHRDRGRDVARSAARARVRVRARGGAEAPAVARVPPGGALGPAGAARARTAPEADSATGVRIRSVGRARGPHDETNR